MDSLHRGFKNLVGIAPLPFDTYHSSVSGVGAVFTKTVTLNARPERVGRTIVNLGGGALLNRVALANLGLTAFLAKRLPYLDSLEVPVWVSITGENADEFAVLASAMAAAKARTRNLTGLEINVSCPNGLARFQPDLIRAVVAATRKNWRDLLTVKLAPGPNLEAEVAAVQNAGGACVTLTNTLRTRIQHEGESLDGGISGPPLHGHALRAIKVIRSRFGTEIDIIGCGGVDTAASAREMLEAGAGHVLVGTAEWLQPGTTCSIAMELGDFTPHHHRNQALDAHV